MKHFKLASSFFLFFLFTLTLSSCELFKDLLEENTRKVERKDFVGLWKNDSLITNVYTNNVLTDTKKQSLSGNTFEMRENGTYTTTGVGGTYLDGTWKLVANKSKYQILLDKGNSLERSYDVKLISKNKLVTNRKVEIGDGLTEEYTFSYFK